MTNIYFMDDNGLRHLQIPDIVTAEQASLLVKQESFKPIDNRVFVTYKR